MTAAEVTDFFLIQCEWAGNSVDVDLDVLVGETLGIHAPTVFAHVNELEVRGWIADAPHRDGGEESGMKQESAEALGRTLAVIGGKWTVEIVSALFGGPHRYGDIRATIGGITPRMLSLRLKELERQGFVTRTLYLEIPPRVEYALTDAGRTLGPIIAAMVSWGEAHDERKKET